MAGDSFYWSAPWRRARAAHLAEHPQCVTRGCGASASHVDHIVARAAGGAPFDPANLQGLCARCHSRKTASADGGFGNRTGGPVRIPGCTADGNPADPSHRWNR